MAALDKTYCSTYKEYLEVVEWCNCHVFYPRGHKIEFYCYEWSEEAFDTPKPVFNTDHAQDYFLIKYCPLEVVQNRMKEVYSKEYYNSVKNGTSEYDSFKYPRRGTKVRLVSSWLNTNKLYPYRRNSYIQFIEVYYNNNLLWYYHEDDIFALPYELISGGCSSNNVSHCKTLKSLIRQLRKLHLPIGAEIRVTGRFEGEFYNFKVY